MPYFIMMCGLPGSGKSTIALDLAKDFDARIHSSDAIRAQILGDENSQENNEKVFSILHERIKDDLQRGKNTIYDATNINHRKRKDFLLTLNQINCQKVIVVAATPYEECLRRDSLRERSVGTSVIKRMYMNFYLPWYYEGWDEIKIVYPRDMQFLSIEETIEDLKSIPHDNPHHSYSIGDHCVAAWTRIKDRKSLSLDIKEAMLLHDIGKKFTRTFKNKKGEETEVAHYYQHHFTGAYDSLFIVSNNKLSLYSYSKSDPDVYLWLLKRAIYIQWHMTPYLWGKKEQKYRQLWGEHLYKTIMVLHRADRQAH